MKHTTCLLALILGPFTFLQAQTWTQLSAGSEFSVAMRSDSTLWSWGINLAGQLGTGTTDPEALPVQVGTSANWKTADAGALHVLAVRTDGTLWAWGLNGSGQLGVGTSPAQSTVPVQIGTDTDWKAVNAGQAHSMAIKTDGTLWAWGYNANGQLGIGNTADQSTPQQVGTDTNWLAVSAGGAHTLALKTDHTLWACGANATGQLGNNSTTYSDTLIQIGAGTDWERISTGFEFSLGLRSDHTLWSWGFNGNSQLGNGAGSQVNVPTQVGTDGDWLTMAAGSSFAFAIKTDSTLYGWGYNGQGQLGTGNATTQHVPANIGTETNWVLVAPAEGVYYNGSVFGLHTLGLRSPQQVICATGANYAGQLGNGSQDTEDEFNCTTGELSGAGLYEAELSGVTVAPNPATGWTVVTMEKPASEPVQVELRSVTGALIAQGMLTNGKLWLDLSGVPQGICFLTVSANGLKHVGKIVVE